MSACVRTSNTVALCENYSTVCVQGRVPRIGKFLEYTEVVFRGSIHSVNKRKTRYLPSRRNRSRRKHWREKKWETWKIKQTKWGRCRPVCFNPTYYRFFMSLLASFHLALINYLLFITLTKFCSFTSSPKHVLRTSYQNASFMKYKILKVKYKPEARYRLNWVTSILISYKQIYTLQFITTSLH